MHNDASATLLDFVNLDTETAVDVSNSRFSARYTLYTLIKSSGTDPVTGDIYSGLDLFRCIKELRCQNITTSAVPSLVDYGCNRASGRTWQAIRCTTGDYDWLYNYDGLQRATGGTCRALLGSLYFWTV